MREIKNDPKCFGNYNEETNEDCYNCDFKYECEAVDNITANFAGMKSLETKQEEEAGKNIKEV